MRGRAGGTVTPRDRLTGPIGTADTLRGADDGPVTLDGGPLRLDGGPSGSAGKIIDPVAVGQGGPMAAGSDGENPAGAPARAVVNDSSMRPEPIGGVVCAELGGAVGTDRIDELVEIDPIGGVVEADPAGRVPSSGVVIGERAGAGLSCAAIDDSVRPPMGPTCPPAGPAIGPTWPPAGPAIGPTCPPIGPAIDPIGPIGPPVGPIGPIGPPVGPIGPGGGGGTTGRAILRHTPSVVKASQPQRSQRKRAWASHNAQASMAMR